MDLFAQQLPFQLVWDATSFKAFKACPRKYQYMMIERIQRKGRSIHLEWGIALHGALEAYDKALASGQSPDDAEAEALRFALGYQLPEADEPAKTKETLLRSIVWYLDQYRDDPARTVILANGEPAVELSFKFHLTEVNGFAVYWAGHIDRLVEYNDQLWFMDRKTTKGQLNQRYFAGFQPDLQMYGYTLAGRVAFDVEVAGGIVDAIQVGATFARFGRHLLHIRNEQVDEFIRSAEWYFRFAYECAETGEWPMNESSCNDFFGCPYRELCAHAPTERHFFMSDYEPFEWNPTEER